MIWRRARLYAAGGLALFAFASGACSKKQDVVVQTAAQKGMTAEEIDADPLALLPKGAIGVFTIDAQKLFASELGRKALEIANARVPVPPSAGFDAGRDLEHVYAGSYSMQGVDVVAVLKGVFDPEKIAAAAGSTEQTPLGVPLVKSTYAGRTLYTAENVGFVVLTSRTVLVGNETALRRALDRIHEGRAKRELPAFADKLLATSNAATAGGADFRTEAIGEAAVRQLPFLNGLQAVQYVGNFEPPGMNFAGTLTYADEASAARGAENARRLRQTLQNYAFLMAIIGISQPVDKLEIQAQGKDAQFVLALDGQALARLLDKAQTFLGNPHSQPVPATLSPGVAR